MTNKSLPMPITVKPYLHQQQAFDFACMRFGLLPSDFRSNGVALLMEMGTGKTITSIGISGILYQFGRVNRILVVAPLSILGVWEEEFEKFAAFPYTLTILKGASAKKRQQLSEVGKTDGLEIVVVNYESARILETELLKFNADLIIADEGHKLKEKGEVLLTIMASLAQQESQSLSQNVKLGLQFRYQAGKVQVNHNRFLGYTKDDEGNLVIVPEEAEIVLRIYREYLEGASLFQIGQGLEADGIKTAAGSDYWLQSTLKKILTNEKYIGDALLQKTYTVDFLNKKRVANNGIVPQYYVENSHPAIIPREKFMKVREEMYRRAHMECGPDQKRRIYSSRYALSSIVYCAHCNDIFRRINWNNRGCKSTVWRCLSRVEKDRPSCTARTVKEELLHEVVVRAVNEVITGSSSFIPALQASFERCLGDSNSAAVEGIDAHLLELQQELLKLANAKQNYETLADEIDELRAEKEELLLQEANKEGIRQRIADMMAYLQSEPEEVTEYSEALVRRMIEKITVYDDHFVVEFKSGIEITINE